MSRQRGVEYQALFSPFVFGSQIIFTYICAKDLLPNDFRNTLLIVNLSLILQFSDFGGLFSTYLLANEYFNNPKKVNLVKLLKTLKYIIATASFGLFLITIFWKLNLINYFMLLFISFSMVNQVVAWFSIVNRAQGKELKYSITFNSSWPLALIAILVTKIFEFDLKSFYFLLPVSASIILNSWLIIPTIKAIRTTKSTNDVNNSQGTKSTNIKGLVFSSFLIHATNTISIYSDRYLLNFNSDTLTVNKYLIYTQIAFGCMTLTNTLYTTHSKFSTTTDISDRDITKAFIKYTTAFLVLTPIALIFVINTYYKTEIDFVLILLIEVVLIIYSLLKRLQVQFSYISLLSIQIRGNILQLIFFPVLYYSLHNYPHEYSILAALIFSMLINLSYLTRLHVRIRNIHTP
jgi:hypothetical protein